jgi:hypothetical protein
VSAINKLTPYEYEEKIIKKSVIPADISFYKEGGHQFNCVQFKNYWVVATDAKEYHNLMYQRVFNKIYRIIRIH